MDFPASLGYQNEKLITNEKKNMTRGGFKPATSCVAGRYSYVLAIDVSCYRKLNKQYMQEIN